MQKAELIELTRNSPVEYLFFWGHQPPKSGVSKSCFSQWYKATFTIDDIVYLTAEHFMMAEKARLFNDTALLAEIVAATTPKAAKALGRKIKNFEQETWVQHRFDIVVRANKAKFEQNETLKLFLLKTGSTVLAEASPTDKIWGIGLAADNPQAPDPSCWTGLNLLGFALMAVRDDLLT